MVVEVGEIHRMIYFIGFGILVALAALYGDKIGEIIYRFYQWIKE